MNKLSLNCKLFFQLFIKKTNIVVFNSLRHFSENLTINVGRQPTRQTKNVKFLAILLDLDEHLNLEISFA